MEEQNPQKKTEGMTRIVLRTLASPLPLAFFAFGKPLLGLVITLASKTCRERRSSP
ncbi:MAG TPA: hypothetical protein VGR18_05865 [Rubrobacter sp.]|nr:hypothetical protein [Rubrobacter sp.]